MNASNARSTPLVTVRRVYEEPSPDDGTRVLVDRLWPRGLRKAEARIDLWLKDVAPSNELRRWFGHDPDRWREFRHRYLEELRHNPEPVEELIRRVREGKVTLLYGASDTEHNNAVVLAEYLNSELKASGAPGQTAT